MAKLAKVWSGYLLIVIISVSLHWTANGQTVTVSDRDVIAIRGIDGHFFQKICFVDDTTNVGEIQWLKGETVIQTDTPQSSSFYSIPNNMMTSANEGAYFCRLMLNNGTFTPKFSAGRLTVLENDVIVAPPVQYGILATNVELQCGINDDELTIVDTWAVGDSESFDPMATELSSVNTTHEGRYTCRLSDVNADMVPVDIPIIFIITILPVISPTPSVYTFTGDSFEDIAISYSGRNETTTTVQWTKEGELLPITGSNYMIKTSFSEHFMATTTLMITSGPLSRSLSGHYDVIITNNNDIIPQDQRTDNHPFSISVKVLPANITEVEESFISPTSSSIMWTVVYRYDDEHPDNITILLKNLNTRTQRSYIVNDPVSRISSEVEVVPGTQYSVTLESANQDGRRLTEPYTFSTDTAPPSVRELNVTRINSTSFQLTTSLYYTGGGLITNFNISFRTIGETEWSGVTVVPVEEVPNSNQLQWTGIVNNQQFAQFKRFEFRVLAANDQGHVSTTQLIAEPLELPDPPVRIEAVSTTMTSAVIEIELSPKGTAPLIVIMELTSHPELDCCNNQTTFIMGDIVRISVDGLSKDTTYTINVYAENLEGKGSGKQESFSTDGDVKTLEMWQAVLIGVCGAIALGVLLVLFCVLLCCGCKASKKWGRKEYHTGPIEMKHRELDRGNPMLTRSNRSNGYAGSQISYGSNQGRPLTPRTPTGMSVTSPSFEYTDAPKYEDFNTSRVGSSTSPFHATSRDKLTQVTSVSHSNLFYPTYPHDFSNEVNYQSLPRGMDAGYQFGSITLSPPPAPAHLSTDV